jgi:hypothetical protein
VFKAQYMATPDGAGRRVLLDAAVAELDAQMGPQMVQVRSMVNGGLLDCLFGLLLEVCQLLLCVCAGAAAATNATASLLSLILICAHALFVYMQQHLAAGMADCLVLLLLPLLLSLAGAEPGPPWCQVPLQVAET